MKFKILFQLVLQKTILNIDNNAIKRLQGFSDHVE